MSRVVVEPNADPRLAEALETSVGWPRGKGEADRRFSVATGFVGRVEGVLAGSVTVALYPDPAGGVALAWVGGMVVPPSHQRTGVGSALLEAVLEHADAAGARVVGLDATEAGRPLYERAGFVPVARSARWVRDASEVRAFSARGHSVHPISLSETMELRDHDLGAFGAQRLPWLLAVLADFPWTAFMARDRATGTMSGFVLATERMVGPLVADDEDAARALLAAALRAGAPGAACVPSWNPRAEGVFRDAGFAPTATSCLRMTRGGALPGSATRVFGLGSWATG